MDHHARVLQQRIEVAALRPPAAEALERIRREQHEQQEADARRGPSPRARARACARRQVAREAAPPRTSSRRASASTAAASLRASPTSRRSGRRGQLRVGVGARRSAPRSRCVTKLVGEAANAIATSTNWPSAAGRAIAISAASRRAARRRAAACPARARRASARIEREVAELGNHCSAFAHRLASRLSSLRLLERVPRPRAACSSRRAWPAPRSRGTCRRRRASPARPRPCPP